jgi:hypothetical protein
VISQRAAYEALALRLEDADLDLIIGGPTALHRLPAAYLVSTVIEGLPRRTFGGAQSVRLRPTLTLAVAWQEQHEAEYQIVDLVDRVAGVLWSAPLDEVCTAVIETVTYDVRDVGGVPYRVADCAVVLTQLGGS